MKSKGVVLVLCCVYFFTMRAADTIWDAAADYKLESLKRFVEVEKQDVNAKDSDSNTPLHWACRLKKKGFLNQKPVVEYLLQKGAKVKEKNKDGNTALHLIAGANSPSIMDLLVKAGADIEAVDSFGQTPLHTAAEWGYGSEVAYLVGKGANVNRKDDLGQTALHKAAKSIRDVAFKVELLLEKGGDITIKDTSGETTLDILKRNGKNKLASFLQEKLNAQNMQNLADALAFLAQS